MLSFFNFLKRVVLCMPSSSAVFSLLKLFFLRAFNISSLSRRERAVFMSGEGEVLMEIISGGRCSIFISSPEHRIKALSITFSSSLIFPGQS